MMRRSKSNHLPEDVKDFLDEYHLTTGELCELLGISRTAPYQWKRMPNDRAAQLEVALDLTPGILGRHTNQQGQRNDLVGVEAHRVEFSHLSWRRNSDGAIREIPKGLHPFEDLPEGYQVVG